MGPAKYRPQGKRFCPTCREREVLRKLRDQVVEYLGPILPFPFLPFPDTWPHLYLASRDKGKASAESALKSSVLVDSVLRLSKQLPHVREVVSEGTNFI